MSTRAGIVVTGTEVLNGEIADQNGPWVSARLLEHGVDVVHTTICGDRPADMTAQLRFLTDQGVDLIITTGGLGPTADDLTVATVADFCGRPLHTDPALLDQIAAIIRGWGRYPDELPASVTAAIAKQALVPDGVLPIAPTGTAPGVAIPAADGRPAILILPGPPRELQGMWPDALATAPIADVLARADDLEHRRMRAFGLSEADLAQTLQRAEVELPGFGSLEVTTCMRGGELDISTRFRHDDEQTYLDLKTLLQQAHSREFYSPDGTTLDDLLAEALAGRTIATAESCTGGMIASRLIDRPGSSSYVLGGIVAYANSAKTGVLGVPAALIDEHGVALTVAAALLVAVAAAAVVLPLHPMTSKLDRNLFVTWPVPNLVFEPAPSDGPVQIEVTYRVHPDQRNDFLAAMTDLARSRRRTGGRSWRLYCSGEKPDIHIEQFVVPSWSEYQRQRTQRWTGADHANILRVAEVAERIDQRHLFTEAVH